MEAGKKYPENYIFNQNLLEENRLPARTLLIPAQKRGVTHKNFDESNRVQLLSGEWRFRYLTEDTDEPFYSPDLKDSDWDTLKVPSMWQFCGYGSCLYPNVRYCFPYDPPYIHRDNPVGLYRTAFTAKKGFSKTVLRFLGVDNAFFVWLNGKYVGFSKGSRIPAEFDVTNAVKDGKNLLAVKVYTYSDASYLENQDMLMASGIFRDVMLIYTGENSLADYTLLPDESGFTVKYSCETGKNAAFIRFTLQSPDGGDCAEKELPIKNTGEVFLPVNNAVTWNAEQPQLYTLFIEIIENGNVVEIHTKKAGIAKSRIEGCRLLMNGSPITLKGVNRHENNAKTGRAITAKQIEAELKDIKSCNLNAIRCSHYTNHPLFYELCSEIGIYVMDEADCESHGAECTGDQGALNKDDSWFNAFFDRVSRMYLINKNETCVNIWSLGNECGEGQNGDKCVSWLCEQDVKKPVKDNRDPSLPCGRFCETGYMPMSVLHDSSAENGPLMMLEYAHAMGNSPGGLEDVWNWVYENEHCCGGYVWEYKSHGFYEKGKNGRPRYLYGGDFPDLYHWSNFSLDGYHTSDGTPKPSWDELREVSAPVHVRFEENGVTVKNTNDFLPLDGVRMLWSVSENGEKYTEKEFCLDDLKAREERFFAVPKETDGFCGLVTEDCVFIKDGKKTAHKQKILANIPDEDTLPEEFEHSVEKERDGVTVTGEYFSAEFKNGLLCRLERCGVTLISSPVRLNMMRAPTDNDGIVGFSPRLIEEWEGRLVDSMRFGCYKTEVYDTPSQVTVTATGKFLPSSHFWGFDTTLIYKVRAFGEVEIEVDVRPYGKDLPWALPRAGLVFELSKDYSHCRWLGRGPKENYPDRKASAPAGLYEADLKDMNFEYDVPQETGTRCDCRTLTVSGEEKSLSVSGDFAFSFHDFTLENLIKARHSDELEKSEKRYLYIDHRHRGLGSNSCGPQPEERYELRPGAFKWTITLNNEFYERKKPSPFEKRWIELFAGDIPEKDLKKYVKSTGNLIWHVFSWGLRPDGSYLSGDAARRAFDEADKKGAAYYEPWPGDGAKIRSYDCPSAAFLDTLTECYVISADESWTYIVTHEGDPLGPYFCRKEKEE